MVDPDYNTNVRMLLLFLFEISQQLFVQLFLIYFLLLNLLDLFREFFGVLVSNSRQTNNSCCVILWIDHQLQEMSKDL